MNHDSDKEMDILLRRHLRRGKTRVESARDAHMDADELSAYAEGALPEAARVRYMSHLADCDSCRKMVTELLLSSQSVEPEEGINVAQTVEAPGRSWREWLAALFSPPVLRYAAPAVALIAFASIVFIVVTRNREVTSLVTQNEPNRQQSANSAAPTRGDETGTTSNSTSSGVDNHGVNPNTNASGTVPSAGTTTTVQQQKDANTAAAPPAQTETVDSVEPKTSDVAANEPQPPAPQKSVTESKATALPQQPSVAPADSAKGKSESDLAMEQKRREGNEVSTAGAAPATTAGTVNGRRGSRSTEPANASALGAARESGEERKQNQVAKSAPQPAARARRDARDAMGDDDEYSAATRTVAGKRFRQQNGVWVDISYNSSRSSVRVKRNSEQYRALVADEPIIGTVSNSLGGDVIVVVRGRAYHIY